VPWGEGLGKGDRVRDSRRVPILYASHAPAEIERLAHVVLQIENGLLIADRRDGMAERLDGAETAF